MTGLFIENKSDPRAVESETMGRDEGQMDLPSFFLETETQREGVCVCVCVRCVCVCVYLFV